MALFTKESIETLRQRVDIVEVISSHIDLKAAGTSYKGLCPFHDEKTPSFVVQRGDSHYHCFGCGAHGDAIQFLMAYQQLSFVDAVESLAQKFNVHLERTAGSDEPKGPPKAHLKEALEATCRHYQFMLQHSEEGHRALKYLYERGVDLEFIDRFRVGLAPKESGFIKKMLSTYKEDILLQAGLLNSKGRDFFFDRITFPICDAQGAVIGFSARKWHEDTFGGKYVNTTETSLFKKNRVLFGLHHCRRRIAKEKRAVVVEGQIDALRLIQEGLDITVAGQGTAFGEGHVRELLNLGVQEVFLAMDGDRAGRDAAAKIGNLFQKESVAVKVMNIPPGSDPDTFLKERGIHSFVEMMEQASDYLTFLVEWLSQDIDIKTPAGKTALIKKVSEQVRAWESEVMVYESLRQLARLMDVPEDMVGVGQRHMPVTMVRHSYTVSGNEIKTSRVLEIDLLRWLVLAGHSNPLFIEMVRLNLTGDHFEDAACRKLFEAYMKVAAGGQQVDLLQLASDIDDEAIVSEIFEKRVNKERAETQLHDTIKRLMDRRWMNECEEVRAQISSGKLEDDEALKLVKEYDTLRRHPPQVHSLIT